MNGGLRSRLIAGFLGVTALTVLISAVMAVIGALFIFVRHPIGSAQFGRDLLGTAVLSDLSNRGLVILVIVAGLALLVVSVGTALLVAQRVLRPVRTLARAAELVAAGDLALRLQPVGDDELAHLVRNFNEMTANLDRSMGELRRLESLSRRFASDVSHELRSPLAAMTAVTEVLSDEAQGMSPPAARAARLVVQEIAHLEGLITDLIEISRFDAGTATLDADVVGLPGAVEACLSLRGWVGQVVVSIPDGLEVLADRRRLDVILANLIGNAIRYGAPPVEVAAGPSRDGRSVVLTVADRGPGLPEEALPYLFDRFYKAESARTRSDGSGLGLAIALENAWLHGGDLQADNREGGGAIFTVVLPCPTPGPDQGAT